MCGADIEQTIKDLMPEMPQNWYIGELIIRLVCDGDVPVRLDHDWTGIKRQVEFCIDEYIRKRSIMKL